MISVNLFGVGVDPARSIVSNGVDPVKSREAGISLRVKLLTGLTNHFPLLY